MLFVVTLGEGSCGEVRGRPQSGLNHMGSCPWPFQGGTPLHKFLPICPLYSNICYVLVYSRLSSHLINFYVDRDESMFYDIKCMYAFMLHPDASS